MLAKPLEHGAVAAQVEGLGRALAVQHPESAQLDIGEVEPIHRDAGDRAVQVVQALDELAGQRRFPRSRRTGDADDRPPTHGVAQPHDAVGEVDHGRVGDHAGDRLTYNCSPM